MEYAEIKEKKKISLGTKIALVSLIFVLLIVLVSISLLSTSRNSRDIDRLSAIMNIRSGLEMYFLDHVSYPRIVGNSCGVASGGLSGCCLDQDGFKTECKGKVYIEKIPPDPAGNTNRGFLYTPNEVGDSYILTYSLEGQNSYLTPGFHKATPFNVGE